MLRLNTALQKQNSWWITSSNICILLSINLSVLPMNQTHYQRTPLAALHNYFTTISESLAEPFSLPHLCWNTCYGSSFPGGCSPPSTSTRSYLRLPDWSLLLPSTKELDARKSCCHEDVQVAPMWPVRTSQTSSVPMTTSDTWLVSWKITDLPL